MINRMRKYLTFTCLQGNDVVTAGVSDHHPIVHDGVLFWNIMMKASSRKHEEKIVGYNNGFGKEEKSDARYVRRLLKIANVIAEICKIDSSIEIIGLCEGPIKKPHVGQFYQALSSYPSLAKFIKKSGFYIPKETGDNWGLLMLANKKVSVRKENYLAKYPCDELISKKLQNRFQVWKLNSNGVEKYFALMYLPYGGDVFVRDKKALSKPGARYCSIVENLMELYEDKILFVAGDFNFNPIFIDKNPLGQHIPPHNSILWPNETVTVDAILLSKAERQRIIANKVYSSSLLLEHGLFNQFKNSLIDENYHRELSLRTMCDNTHALTAYSQRR